MYKKWMALVVAAVLAVCHASQNTTSPIASEAIWSRAVFGRIITSISPPIQFSFHTSGYNRDAVLNVLCLEDYVISKNVQGKDIEESMNSLLRLGAGPAMHINSLREIASAGGGYIEITILENGAPVLQAKRILLGLEWSESLKSSIDTALNFLYQYSAGTAIQTRVDRIQRLCGLKSPVFISGDTVELTYLREGVSAIVKDPGLMRGVTKLDISRMIALRFNRKDLDALRRIVMDRGLCLIVAFGDAGYYNRELEIPKAQILSAPERLNPMMLDPLLFRWK